LTLPHGGNIYFYADKYGIPEDGFLDFSASINPLGPSKAAVRAMKDAVPSLVNYPDPRCSGLKDALSVHLDVLKESLLIGNGSTELIYLIPRALKAKKVLVFAPTFSDYARASGISGAKVSHITLREKDGFLPDMDRLKSALSGMDMFFLCNPNNPTGAVIEKDALLDILGMARKADAFVVVDEAFIEYAPGHSVINEAVQSKKVAVLRNFTKFYGMPGLRAGYLAADPSVVEKLGAAKEPWSVNTLAERAAIASLSDEAYIRRSLNLVEKEKEHLYAGLSEITGLRPYPPSVNFILVKLTGRWNNAAELSESLAAKGILIRDCSNFRGLDGRFFRVAVRGREDNDALCTALRESLSFTQA